MQLWTPVESASASEEMSAQAEQMKEIGTNLGLLISGKDTHQYQPTGENESCMEWDAAADDKPMMNEIKAKDIKKSVSSPGNNKNATARKLIPMEKENVQTL